MNHPSPERWSMIRGLFFRAVEVAPSERAAFIHSQARSDSVAADVLALLEGDAASATFAENPASAIGLTSPGGAGSSRTLEAGSMVGGYRIIARLAEGAFGLVYVAEQQRPTRRVAVKVLRPDVTSRTSLIRFQFEPEFLAALTHPGIAQVYESGVLPAPDGRPYFAMELVDGVPITEFGRALPLRERLRVLIEVCHAVQHAHSRGIIHRDLKPTNVLVTPDGHPKLLDFGVARLVGNDGRTATPAGFSSQLIGTLAYLAPEYAQATAAVPDVRADVYSLGVMLFELVAGRPHLDLAGRPLNECLLVVARTPGPSLRSAVRGADADLDLIVSTATRAEPEGRYATVSNLAADLERYLLNEPISIRRPSLGYEIRKLAARNRLAAGLLLTGVVSTLGLLGWLTAERRASSTRLVAARATVDSLLRDAMKRLNSTPGTVETRERIIAQIEGPLERLLSLDPADATLRHNRARLVKAKADVALDRGQWKLLEPMRRLVVNELEDLSNARPSDLALRAELATAYVQLGDAFKNGGQFVKTLAWYSRAHAIDQELTALDPNDPSTRDDLVWSYLRLSDLAMSQGKQDEASTLADQTVACARDLMATDPHRPESHFALLTALSHRYDLDLASLPGDAESRALAESLEVGRDLLRMAPSDRGYLHQHAQNCIKASHREVARARLDRARELLDEAAARINELALGDPATWRTLTLQSYLQYSLARLERAAGNTEAASGHASQAREVAWRIVNTHGSDHGAVIDAVGTIYRDLDLDFSPDHDSIVRAEHTRICHVLEQLAESASPPPRVLASLISIYRASPVPELRSAGKAMALAERWVQVEPDSPSAKVILGEVLLEAGDEFRASGIWRAIRQEDRPLDGPLRERFGR
ncbi:MAG: protein kinase [Phycisphaerales bacterium]|nr:protein kinase [Phycisphaerales bacterium]